MRLRLQRAVVIFRAVAGRGFGLLPLKRHEEELHGMDLPSVWGQLAVRGILRLVLSTAQACFLRPLAKPDERCGQRGCACSEGNRQPVHSDVRRVAKSHARPDLSGESCGAGGTHPFGAVTTGPRWSDSGEDYLLPDWIGTKMSEEGQLAVLNFYVGPSLYDGDIAPVEVVVDHDVLGALWAADPVAWEALLHFVGDDIKNDGE